MNSTLKTFLLLGILSLLILFLGGILGGEQGFITAFIISLLMNGGAYFFSDKMALMASRAKPLTQKQQPEMFKMVQELSNAMSLPMPKLYITPETQANAFATGRDPHHASIAVTQGIIQSLTREELKAVIAHELAHIKNRDILIASIAAVFASTISFLANMALWGGSRDDDDNNGSGALGLVAAIVLPIGASIIQMAVSREREFIADDSGAKAIGTGEPLAKALLSIHRSSQIHPMETNPAFASLYIGNPIGDVGGKLMQLFSTHPPVEDRIARLRKLRVLK